MYLIRKFFWGTIASGTLLFFSGYTRVPERLVTNLKALNELKKRAQKPETETVGTPTDEQIFEAIERENFAHIPEYSDEPVVPNRQLKTEEPKVEYVERVEVHNDTKFVLINGKYYEYRPDHIYMINGVKTYFVDNKKVVTAIIGVPGSKFATMRVANLEPGTF